MLVFVAPENDEALEVKALMCQYNNNVILLNN